MQEDNDLSHLVIWLPPILLRADEKRNAEIVNRIPAGRWGFPEDLADPLMFLAAAASDYVNGYTVAVDGGWLAR